MLEFRGSRSTVVVWCGKAAIEIVVALVGAKMRLFAFSSAHSTQNCCLAF